MSYGFNMKSKTLKYLLWKG